MTSERHCRFLGCKSGEKEGDSDGPLCLTGKAYNREGFSTHIAYTETGRGIKVGRRWGVGQ